MEEKIKAYTYILGALFLISLTTHTGPSSEMLHLWKIY